VCGDDGTCVDEAAVVYLAPNGIDTGYCDRNAPCRSLAFGVGKATATRNHIVLAPGTYSESNIEIDSTLATKIIIHGNGASINAGSATAISTRIPTTIRDLQLISTLPNTGGIHYPALGVVSDTIIERVKITARHGIVVFAGLDARNVSIEVTDTAEGSGIGVGAGKLMLDGATIVGGATGIVAIAQAVNVEIRNALVYGTSKLAVDLSGALGTVEFSTFVYSGSQAVTGPRALKCGMIDVRASIVWDRNSSMQSPSIAGPCTLASVIAGTYPVPGAMAMDPMFIDEANDDYHLSSNSPARDMVNTGPDHDFEAGPRPTGERFDIGADETP
jgi:hypothetical protein